MAPGSWRSDHTTRWWQRKVITRSCTASKPRLTADPWSCSGRKADHVQALIRRESNALVVQPLESFCIILALLDRLDRPCENEASRRGCPADLFPCASPAISSKG